jgi:hypothetical protein
VEEAEEEEEEEGVLLVFVPVLFFLPIRLSYIRNYWSLSLSLSLSPSLFFIGFDFFSSYSLSGCVMGSRSGGMISVQLAK